VCDLCKTLGDFFDWIIFCWRTFFIIIYIMFCNMLEKFVAILYSVEIENTKGRLDLK